MIDKTLLIRAKNIPTHSTAADCDIVCDNVRAHLVMSFFIPHINQPHELESQCAIDETYKVVSRDDKMHTHDVCGSRRSAVSCRAMGHL